ncbi:MAG: hypothetical protein ACLPTZ_21160 [Beijerinckiaceae bacterium]
MEKFSELSSMQEEMTRAKLAFHEKFQHTLAYQMLSPMSVYQTRRLELLKGACWDFRCAVSRKDLIGAGAERALSLLGSLNEELRDAIWLPEHIPAAPVSGTRH